MNSGYNINIRRGKKYSTNSRIYYYSAHENDIEYLRLLILSGTTYANEFKRFAQRMNSLLADMKIQIVMSTGPSLSRKRQVIVLFVVMDYLLILGSG